VFLFYTFNKKFKLIYIFKTTSQVVNFKFVKNYLTFFVAKIIGQFFLIVKEIREIRLKFKSYVTFLLT